MITEDSAASQESQEQAQAPEFKVRIADDDKETFFSEKTETSETSEKANTAQETETESTQESSTESTERQAQSQRQPKEEVQVQASEVNEELALKFLNEKLGITATSLEDLKPKEQKKYDALTDKLQEFIEKTGNTNLEDFLATQKDWTGVDDETRVKELMRRENPALSKDDIDFRYKRKYGIDEDNMDEDEIRDRQIELKEQSQKALNFLEKQKQEFMVNRGSEEHIPQEYKEAKATIDGLMQQQKENEVKFTAIRNDFVAQTESLLKQGFEGFEVRVGDEASGFTNLRIAPENVNETKAVQLDVNNFNKKFFDQDGKVLNPTEFHKAYYFAMNPEKVASHFYNLGKAAQAEADEKESKNIQMLPKHKIDSGFGKGITVKVLKD